MMELAALDFQAEGTDIRFVESLRNTGFGVLENHPLDLDLIASIYEHWSDFFKSGRAPSYVLNRDTQDGFFSRDDAESAKGFDEKDIKEYFHFYTWGQCPEDLRDELMTYYRPPMILPLLCCPGLSNNPCRSWRMVTVSRCQT